MILNKNGLKASNGVKFFATTCKKCSRTLYTDMEKEGVLCEDCRLSSGAKCLKCGRTLLRNREAAAGICKECEVRDPKCIKCGSVLYTVSEKSSGVCSRCSRS